MSFFLLFLVILILIVDEEEVVELGIMRVWLFVLGVCVFRR